MARKSITLFVAAALSLAAFGASASPFPVQVNEAGFDNPAAMAYAEQNRPAVSSTTESPFPVSVNEAGFDNSAAIAYAAERIVPIASNTGSPFPWSVNEAGPYVAEADDTVASTFVRTAGR